MISMKHAMIIVAITATTMLLPGVATAHKGHETGAEPDLKLVLNEMYVRAEGTDPGAPIHIEAGKFHLVKVMNNGAAEHELHFGRNADPEAGLYQVNMFGPELEGEHAAHGFLGVVLEPGESASLHFWIPESKTGEWEVGCFIPGHYEAGQHAPLIVE